MRIARRAASVVFAAALALASAAPAFAYLIEMEPSASSDSSGTSDKPYPDATDVGGPDASRAIYGYLSVQERFDAYSFSVEEPVESKLTVLVPDEPASREFGPRVAVIANRGIAMLATDPGDEREPYFDSFAGMSFLVCGERTVRFDPGVRYVIVVSAGSGTTREGSYMILMSGPERFAISDLFDIPRAYLGLYGQSPFRWHVALLWLTAIALLVLLVGSRRRRRKGPRVEPRDIFGI